MVVVSTDSVSAQGVRGGSGRRLVRAFTLIELLVVVAIIAVLIAILIPSLGRAREQAKVVRCAANMKQFYTAIVIYGSENNDTMLPAVLQSGGSQDFLWCGNRQLAPIFNMKRQNSTLSSNMVALQIAKMMDCPAVDHTWFQPDVTASFTGSNWWYDYQYNQNFGYNTAGAGVDPIFQMNGSNAMAFTKRTAVPRETIVMLDDRDKSTNHDYCFSKVGSLVPMTLADLSGQAGAPHFKKANMLFAEGQILLADPNLLLGAPSRNWVIDFRSPKTSPWPF